ncbi:MAG: uL15 family ribosomal protein [Candidatus Paceibacterota bacterium]|jgi:large subunit ribosomal protein L15
MQIHEIQPIHKNKTRKRVGRGGKRGTYCGHGQKGQSSRAGRKFQPVIREFIKRYHKLRGYRFGTGKNENIVILQLSVLDKNFGPKEIINPEKLIEKGIITKVNNQIPQVKILGKAEIKKALTIEKCLASKGVTEIVEKAGGQIIVSDRQKEKDSKAKAKEKAVARRAQAKERKASGKQQAKGSTPKKASKAKKASVKNKAKAEKKPKAKK